MDARYKSNTAPPQCYFGISFLFCCVALFLLHLISLKYSPQLPLPPSKDLFMETESLNPCSLYSSEAVRRQLLMSMLMTPPQQGEHSEHLCTASSQRPRCQHLWIVSLEKSSRGQVWGCWDQNMYILYIFSLKTKGSFNVFKENKDEWDKQPTVVKLSSCCWREAAFFS